MRLAFTSLKGFRLQSVRVFLLDYVIGVGAAAGVRADEGEHGCPDEGEAREGGETHAF